MKTKLTYNAGYLHVSSPGLPSFEIPMSERGASLIQAMMNIVYLDGKTDGAEEARESVRKAFNTPTLGDDRTQTAIALSASRGEI